MTHRPIRDAACRASICAALWLAAPVAAMADERVAACETLVSLRVLTAAAPGHGAALARAAGQPGCRVVSRADIGTVEHRAMIGGLPFECLAVRGEAGCLWVQP